MIEHATGAGLDAECVRCIVDDLDVIVVGDSLDSVDVAWITVAVHRKNRGGLGGDRRLDLCGVNVEGGRLDIDEDWFDPVPEQRMCSGDERVRCGDDLAGNAEGLKRGYQCERAIGKKRDVPDPKVLT